MTTEVFAPAKINLALHVTGRRDDGYHLLDSLVVFADVGDLVRVAPAAALTLRITGPEAAGLPAADDNLVLRAARAFDAQKGAAITLEKRLPVASGIGGGSADAAAALKALSRLWGMPLPDAAGVLALGADVPVCLAGRPSRMRGIGERLNAIEGLPGGLAMVLVNPRVVVSTPVVFSGLARRDNPPIQDTAVTGQSAEAFAGWLAEQRNDLEQPAIATAPVIGQVLSAIGATGSLLVRMSGSGATCFGLFADLAAADRAAGSLAASHPEWWVRAARVLN